jgi:hypothetical protein
VVPTREPGPTAGAARGTQVRLDLPAARRAGPRAVGVYTSPFAQYHAVGPRPFATVAGWAVVEALEDDADLVVDPGLPWAWRPPRQVLAQLAERRPAAR